MSSTRHSTVNIVRCSIPMRRQEPWTVGVDSIHRGSYSDGKESTRKEKRRKSYTTRGSGIRDTIHGSFVPVTPYYLCPHLLPGSGFWPHIVRTKTQSMSPLVGWVRPKYPVPRYAPCSHPERCGPASVRPYNRPLERTLETSIVYTFKVSHIHLKD